MYAQQVILQLLDNSTNQSFFRDTLQQHCSVVHTNYGLTDLSKVPYPVDINV